MAASSLSKLVRSILLLLFLAQLIAFLLLVREARADACIASPPIVPAPTTWCMTSPLNSTEWCGSSVRDLFTLWLADYAVKHPGPNYAACEPCVEEIGSNGEHMVCYVRMLPIPGVNPGSSCGANLFNEGYAIATATTQCKPGYVEHGPGKCAAQDMLDQDAAEAIAGGRIVRDEHGNILSVERPAGKVIETSGNHDQHGRPGFVTEAQTGDSALIIWPADNSCLPDGLIVDQVALRTRWRQPDRELAGVRFPDSTDYMFGYWRHSEDSLAVSVHTEPSGFVERGVWMPDGKFMGWHTARLRTATALAPNSYTAAAVLDPGPAHQPGVHYITQTPPISGTAAVTIAVTAGAMIAYPMIDRINKQIGTWVHRAFAQELSPGELAKLDCEEINEHEVKMCHRFSRHPKTGNFPNDLRPCLEDAEKRHQECINAGSWTGIKTGLRLPGGGIITTPLP